MTGTSGRGPGVDVPPPFYFVAGFLVGWLIDSRFSHLWPSILGSHDGVIDFIGGLMFGVGLALAIWGMATFRRMNTSIFPNRDASALVIVGPYKFMRNPMYTGMTIVYVGLSLKLQVGWAVVFLPVVLWVLNTLVITREERYLTAAFGDQYRRYQREVGRWL